jgi:DNA-directed RNA polymerase subunit RPC12/RpoP
MHSIYITAILTTGLAAAIFVPLIHKLKMPANERLVWLAAGITLPMQPLVFYLVRVPLDHWLVGQLGSTSLTYQWVTSFYAPLTEEPAKLIALLIPAIRRDISVANFVRYALAIGVGFGVGEMWLIAQFVARAPAMAALPFYQFGGYASERLLVCLFHSAFVSVALWRLRHRFVLGFAGAAALHWLGNFPILLLAWNVASLGKIFWSTVIQFWLVAYFVLSLALLSYFTFGRITPGRVLFGRRHCPECGRDYDPTIFFGLNFGRTRYERCPHCRHWHWTKAKTAEDPTEPLRE